MEFGVSDGEGRGTAGEEAGAEDEAGAALVGGTLESTGEGEGVALAATGVAVTSGSTVAVPEGRRASHAMRATSTDTASTSATMRRRSLNIG
ncbi:MAG: hypothetical protein ACTHU1_07710 [Arachnia sp.]